MQHLRAGAVTQRVRSNQNQSNDRLRVRLAKSRSVNAGPFRKLLPHAIATRILCLIGQLPYKVNKGAPTLVRADRTISFEELCSAGFVQPRDQQRRAG